MQIISPPVQRSYWYDRSTISESIEYSGNSIAPHPSTSRDTYIIPANKIGVISGVFMQQERSSVASVLDLTATLIVYTPSGGSAQNICVVYSTSNILDKPYVYKSSGGLFMNEGDKLEIKTSDASTGGAWRYRSYVTITVYDA